MQIMTFLHILCFKSFEALKRILIISPSLIYLFSTNYKSFLHQKILLHQICNKIIIRISTLIVFSKILKWNTLDKLIFRQTLSIFSMAEFINCIMPRIILCLDASHVFFLMIWYNICFVCNSCIIWWLWYDLILWKINKKVSYSLIYDWHYRLNEQILYIYLFCDNDLFV